jgi:hypothetical protein
MNAIHLPPATVKRLEALVAQQQAINAVIEATVATAREALDVPDTYTLRNLAEGFIAPPPEPAREATE